MSFKFRSYYKWQEDRIPCVLKLKELLGMFCSCQTNKSGHLFYWSLEQNPSVLKAFISCLNLNCLISFITKFYPSCLMSQVLSWEARLNAKCLEMRKRSSLFCIKFNDDVKKVL
jgi:hypothetical protein